MGWLLGVVTAIVMASAPVWAQEGVCAPGAEPTDARAGAAGGVDAADALAAAARDLRSRARDADGEAERASVRAELAAVADRVLADVDAAGRARLLVHLHHTHALVRGEAPGAIDPADAWLREAAEVARTAGESALAAHAILERARLAERAGDGVAALELARRASFAAASTDARSTLYAAQALIARRHRALGDEEAALSAYRDAVAGLERMKADLVARSREDATVFAEEVAPTYRGLVDVLLTRAARSAEADVPGTQAALREARDVVESSRQAEIRDYYRDACLTDERATLPEDVPGTVVVYPVSLDDRVELIVARGGRLSRHATGIDALTLETLAEDLRIELEDRMTNRYRRPAQTLYDALVRPIEARLAEAATETLVFVPDGALRQVPIGVLYDRERKRHLVEDYAIALSPGLRMTEPRPIDRTRVQLLGGGLTEAVQGFAPLPNVAEELERVGALFAGETLVDETFRADAFSSALAELPFDVLHIASHGQFSGEPDGNFILTWDDRLSIDVLGETIAQARFRTERPVELIVLSACQTAVGDDRAALGLAGAALRMGARSVVASLWTVNDLASSRLMTLYYEGLADPTLSRAEALRRAQVALLQDDGFGHPNAWAAFILVGSWL